MPLKMVSPAPASNCFGRDGKDIVIKVPLGTVIKDADTGRIMADMSDPEPVVLARGGRGGWGNSHFATPTRQVPRFAKPGLPGEEYEITLELKLLADVGLVGFPNVGKSTLISVVSAAKPKIANYHFTTLTPVLGVVKRGEGNSFVMADIPGLIEGASEGVGLGHEFLRHVDRCRLIVHVVDVSGIEGRDPEEDYAIINRELRGFSEDLAERPQIVAGSKIDMATPEQIESFRRFVEEQGLEFYPISAVTHQGVEELMQAVSRKLADLPPIRSYEPGRFRWRSRPPRQATSSRYPRRKVSMWWMPTGWARFWAASIWTTTRACSTSSVCSSTRASLPSWSAWASRRATPCASWTSSSTLSIDGSIVWTNFLIPACSGKIPGR